MKKILFTLFIILLFTGCDVNLFPNKNLQDGYFIDFGWVDLNFVSELRNKNINFTVLETCVGAVGYDKDNIIVAQHPTYEKHSYEYTVDTSITYYYIIPLTKKISDTIEKNLIGPMKKDEFNKKRMELHIPDNLKFSFFPINYYFLHF
ncbi:MAG: hypothetical protein ABSG15_08120 [FCB group bacterium]|jgi:hypothetical protein